uniref:Uncharacterized protein n=1 Tax=Rhizophora mucronata TaxID=61149 RepID=A0A2P2R3A4_RHIMU
MCHQSQEKVTHHTHILNNSHVEHEYEKIL